MFLYLARHYVKINWMIQKKYLDYNINVNLSGKTGYKIPKIKL